ncbi:MAG: LLM class flavin-dependent oxidoreductase [Chloroflexi bacterium]|nr:LLM class flavin-dependent oxidoreductase [Chloroflexota bacterium]
MAKRGLTFWGETASEYLDVAQQAEAAGFESVWTAEFHRTAFVPLAAAAVRTQRVRLGTGIALSFVRSSLITALTALDLDELSGGRLVLGLGTGVQRLNEDWHGVTYGRPVPHLRELVAVLRMFLAGVTKGGPLTFEGRYYRLNVHGYERPHPPVRERIPIYLAGIGPGMVRLAGEVADGWIGHDLNSPHYVNEVVVPRIDEGLGRSGRSRASFVLCPSVVCAIDHDPWEARRIAAGHVAFYATVRTYAPFFTFLGFESALPAIQSAFRAGDVRGMVNAVPSEMIDACTATGTIDEVRAKVAEYEGVADLIKLSAPYHFLPPETVRAQQQALIKLFAT